MSDEVAQDVWVYLDTNVLIDAELALKGLWSPPAEPSPSDRQKLAAVRVLFYGYRDWNGWYLVVSSETRRELAAGGDKVDWSIGAFLDFDELADRPVPAQVGALAEELTREIRLEGADARHVARAYLYEPISLFLSSDKDLLQRLRRADLAGIGPPRPKRLRIASPLEIESELRMVPGAAASPIMPASGHPLAEGPAWWIPSISEE